MSPARSAAFLLAVGLLYAAAAPLHGAGSTKPYDDPAHGFKTRIPESFKQNPPRPTGEAKYLAAEWYDDQAKYKSSGSQNPQFQLTWWSTPKGKTTTPGTGDAPVDGGVPTPERPPSRQELQDEYGLHSIEEMVDQEIERNTHLFGSSVPPMEARWATGKTGKTNKQKIDFQYVEINAGKSKEKSGPVWYMFVAKLAIDRPSETVTVGFRGYCAREFSDKLGPAYLDIVKNFEYETGAAAATVEAVPTDPDKYLDYLKRTKLVAGWKFAVSPKKEYALIYSDEVDEKLVKTIAEQIESLRTQVYEKLFPPDKPITTISVIRVCKDLTQYQAYHAPQGSAGYWSSWDKELVFYEDTSNKKDSLRVLYHEAFHQYIYYSVGSVDPHSWFNEGHGDYFYGHNFKDGKWELAKSLARVDTANTVKRAGRAPPLKEWLHWSQAKYYAHEAGPLTALENYALGWDIVYFLRTTKKPEYQGILDRYFNALKSACCAARAERDKAVAKAKAEGQGPVPELTPEEEELWSQAHEGEWQEQALAEGFKGVDLDQLNKDWLATLN